MVRDVLWHGRLFFTRNYLCFYGKLFNKAAKVWIPWHEVLAIEKKHAMSMFPSTIRVTTLHSKYTFSAFVKRDAVVHKLKALWKAALQKEVCAL
jgi:hypothetical protein